MVRSIRLELPAIKSYERPRLSQYGVHNSKQYREYKELLTRKIKEQGVWFGDETIAIIINFYFALPKTYRNTKGEPNAQGIERLKTQGAKHINKDVDNLAKAVLDSMNGICFTDDKQVQQLNVSKRYANIDTDVISITIHTL